MESTGIYISDFCDMGRLDKILDNWARSTGLATVAVDAEGVYITRHYNFTDFCEKLTRQSPEGARRCAKCDHEGRGTYLCHAGLVDFASAITLEDGTVLGNILGGQVLPTDPDEDRYRATARELGIDEEEYLTALRKVNIRTQDEIDASAALLRDVVNMFVRTSYTAHKNAASLKEHADIISSLSRVYYCLYYLDLEAGTYLELDSTDEIREHVPPTGELSGIIKESEQHFVDPEFLEAMREFCDISTLDERLRGKSNISMEHISGLSGWARSVFIPVRYDTDGHLTHVLYAMQRIQDEKEAELEMQRRLREAADTANRANRAKSEFLSHMSHDIRTPINGIRGMLDIADCCEDDSGRVSECLQKIRGASDHLYALINDVLNMSKLESDEVQPEDEPFDLRELLESCMDLTAVQAGERGITVGCIGASELEHVHLIGTPLYLRQVLINILDNAVKYGREGGHVEMLASETDCDGKSATYRLSISDDGVGMSEEYLSHVFEPFTQEHGDSRSHYQGTGLGMAITKKLIDRMGGTIEVASELDVGTVFDITVSFALDSNPLPLQKGDEGSVTDITGMNVLVAEDNELNMEIVRFLLEQAGANVYSAWNGQEAVDAFEASEPGYFDLVLMDVMMPVMDGLAAVRAIRALPRPDAASIPIVALTANAFAEDVQKTKDAGMDAHIAKPIDSKQMLQVIAKFAPASR